MRGKRHQSANLSQRPEAPVGANLVFPLFRSVGRTLQSDTCGGVPLVLKWATTHERTSPQPKPPHPRLPLRDITFDPTPIARHAIMPRAMNIPLHPDLQKFIDDQVKAGHYESAEALINTAVARLQSEDFSADDLAELRSEIAPAIAQADRGELEDWDINDIRV